jgi:hypothetical protein
VLKCSVREQISEACIGDLYEKDAVHGDGADRPHVGVANEDVECVEDQADRGVGTMHYRCENRSKGPTQIYHQRQNPEI